MKCALTYFNAYTDNLTSIRSIYTIYVIALASRNHMDYIAIRDYSCVQTGYEL